MDTLDNNTIENIKAVHLVQKYIIKYFDNKKIDHINLDLNDKDTYINKFLTILKPEEDVTKASFIIPKLGLYRISFQVPDEIINKMKNFYDNIDKILYNLRVTHDIIECFGFNLQDMWKAGVVRISYDSAFKETDVVINVSYSKPDRKILNYLEELFFLSHRCIYEIIYKTGSKHITVYNNSNTFNDIIKEINSLYYKSINNE